MVFFGVKIVGIAGRNLRKVAFEIKRACGQIVLIGTIAVDALREEAAEYVQPCFIV